MKCELLVHPDEISTDLIDRFAAAGVSTLGIHPVGGKSAADSLASLLYELSGKSLEEPTEIVVDCVEKYT